MIIVDTNVISELMRPVPDDTVLQWMNAQRKLDIGTTAITVAEILYGIEAVAEGRRKAQLMEAAALLFDSEFRGRILAFDQMAAVEYAAIVIQCRRVGTPISMAYAQIAAICRRAGAPLATRNIRDFAQTGITLINPWLS